MSKYVYFFGDGQADGKADMKNLLGGKGANLAEIGAFEVRHSIAMSHPFRAPSGQDGEGGRGLERFSRGLSG